MATTLQFRRYDTANVANTTGANGELVIDSDKHVVVVQDGTTAGGFPLARAEAYTQANTARDTANGAYAQANGAYGQANGAYGQANGAYGQANGAYSQANTGIDTANGAYAQANGAYGQANGAYGQANVAYGQANGAYAQANAAYGDSNTRVLRAGDTMTGNLNVAATIISQNIIPNLNVTYDLGTSTSRFRDLWLSNSSLHLGEANISAVNDEVHIAKLNVNVLSTASGINIASQSGDAYDQANAARGQANTARTTANDAYIRANTARDDAHNAYDQANAARVQANTAYGQANAAYGQANLKLNLTGGTVSGDLTVSGNLYLSGNTTFVNVATYQVEDPLIYLASNNSIDDAVDIGFMGAKNTSGIYSHTGLVRHAADDTWYLFDGLLDEGHQNNIVDIANTYPATLRANINAFSLLLDGSVVATQANLTIANDQANTARNTANSAYGQANGAYDQANRAYTQANGARDQANTAYGQANSARDQANSAYAEANLKVNLSGGTITGNLTVTEQTKTNVLISTRTALSAPSITQFNGERVRLYNFEQEGRPNYAIGVEGNHIWMGVDDNGSTTGFKWYGNTTLAALLRSNSTFELSNSVIAGGFFTTNGLDVTLQANNARDQANAARDQANTARDVANASYGQANTANNNALEAYDQATYARNQANTARDTANGAYAQANGAYAQANGAYAQANLKVSLAGDTMTGNLNVAATLITQNIIPNLNVTYDLGTPTKRFKDLYLSNSTIYIGETVLTASGDEMRANVFNAAVSVLVSGVNVLDTANGAYAQANGAYAQANGAYAQANGAYAQANSARDVANGAYAQANGAYGQANGAYAQANGAYGQANGAYAQANAAYARANALTIQEIYASNGNVINSVSNVNTIQFDNDAGFNVVDGANGIVSIQMNSTFKNWQMNGVPGLVASGLDTVNFIGQGITIEANNNSSPKSITFTSTALDSYIQANTARDTANGAYAQANGAYAQANGAYGQANGAYAQANGAYAQANLKVSLAGDTMTGNLNVAATIITQNIEPNLNVTYNLGTPTKRFKDLYLSNSTIYIGETVLSASGDEMRANTFNAAVSVLVGGVNVLDTANGAYAQANGAYGQANGAYGQANGAYAQANGAYAQANSARDVANGAYAQANGAYGQANGAYGQANVAYGQANDAYSQANTARNTANDAYTAANNAKVTVYANSGAANATTQTINFVNTSTVLVTVANTSGNANISLSLAGTPYDQANSARDQANTARDQANTARTQANSAYAEANLKLNLTGGTLSGDLTVAGNLTVTGSNTLINVSNLSVNDSIILMANGQVGDIYDIGFVGNFDRGATNTHAGFIRKASLNEFYLFDNYEVEPTNNIIDINGQNFRLGNVRVNTINANSVLILGSAAATQANLTLAHNQANSARDQANTARTTANDAYAEANTAETIALNSYGQANSARDQANTARNQANTAYGQANDAYGQANSARNQANTAYGQANAAYTAANNAKVTVFANSGAANATTQTINFVNTSSILVTVANTSGNANITMAIIGTPYDQANAARDQANTARTTANDAYGKANTADTNALNAYGQANSARDQANTARNTANAAYGQANTATTNAGNAYNQANIAFKAEFTSNIDANTNRTPGSYGSYSFAAANTPTSSGILLSLTGGSDGSGDGWQYWGDYNNYTNLYIRGRWGGTWSSWAQIWGSGNSPKPNTVYDQANSAYGAANNRVLKAGDTMTGILVAAGIRNTKNTVDGTNANTSTGAANNINLDESNFFTRTLTASVAFTFRNAPASGNAQSFTLVIVQNATGGWTPSFTNTVYWAGASAPPATTTANARDVWQFTTFDGGTTYYGTLSIKNAG